MSRREGGPVPAQYQEDLGCDGESWEVRLDESPD